MKGIEVISPGANVLIGDGKIQGQCVSLSIDPGTDGYRISYKVVWWDGNTRKNEWLEECEVQAASKGDGLKIGFARNGWVPGNPMPGIEQGICKGGRNEPNTSKLRPPAPQGSGSK